MKKKVVSVCIILPGYKMKILNYGITGVSVSAIAATVYAILSALQETLDSNINGCHW